MTLEEVLEKAIEDGIKSVNEYFKNPLETDKRTGSIAGFEACKGKSLAELVEIYNESTEYVYSFFKKKHEQHTYIWFRHYQVQVEWICNIASAVLFNEGLPPLLPFLPTARGMMKTASILGVKNS